MTTVPLTTDTPTTSSNAASTIHITQELIQEAREDYYLKDHHDNKETHKRLIGLYVQCKNVLDGKFPSCGYFIEKVREYQKLNEQLNEQLKYVDDRLIIAWIAGVQKLPLLKNVTVEQDLQQPTSARGTSASNNDDRNRRIHAQETANRVAQETARQTEAAAAKHAAGAAAKLAAEAAAKRAAAKAEQAEEAKRAAAKQAEAAKQAAATTEAAKQAEAVKQAEEKKILIEQKRAFVVKRHFINTLRKCNKYSQVDPQANGRITKAVFDLSNNQWPIVRVKLSQSRLLQQTDLIDTTISKLCSRQPKIKDIARNDSFSSCPIPMLHALINRVLQICCDQTKPPLPLKALILEDPALLWDNLVKLAQTLMPPIKKAAPSKSNSKKEIKTFRNAIKIIQSSISPGRDGFGTIVRASKHIAQNLFRKYKQEWLINGGAGTSFLPPSNSPEIISQLCSKECDLDKVIALTDKFKTSAVPTFIAIVQAALYECLQLGPASEQKQLITGNLGTFENNLTGLANELLNKKYLNTWK